ncbi:MAG: helix-turn-helix transcriptional regulator [Bdellovibrionales bacterium]|nr:XRE family transcriptional regulator [Bdellovibrionales bacterium]NQZ18309.1 helix-turn-helix transcriptional regulator [Bdellovibrionales bacterium]
MDRTTTLASQNLAKNIESLRKARQMSQNQLSQIAGLPRSTLTHIESGSGNPSLQNLIRIAQALQVSIEELLSQPRDEISHITSDKITVKRRKSGIEVYKLLPDPIPSMEIDKIVLPPDGRMKGTPHTLKTKEYFHCVEGVIDIFVGKQKMTLKKGDVLAFPGDRPHAYVNPSSHKRAWGFSVVVLNHNYSHS